MTPDEIAGTWVRNCDMDPAVNIMNRRWWARGNYEGTYRGPGSIPHEVKMDDLWWHFPTASSRKETQ